jgi:hypothetical protein
VAAAVRRRRLLVAAGLGSADQPSLGGSVAVGGWCRRRLKIGCETEPLFCASDRRQAERGIRDAVNILNYLSHIAFQYTMIFRMRSFLISDIDTSQRSVDCRIEALCGAD